MPIRVCPFCNRNLRPFEHYFCTACGKKLPSDVIKPFEITKHRRIAPETKPKSQLLALLKGIDKRRVISVGLILGGVACIVLIFVNVVPRLPSIRYLNPFSKTKVVVDSAVTVEKIPVGDPQRTVESQMEFNSGVFGISDFAKTVPFEAQVYIEVVDVRWALTNEAFFGEELSSLAGKVDVPFCAFAYVDETGNVTWSFMLDHKEGEDIQSMFSMLSSDYWKDRIVAGKIVISGRDEIFDMVSKSAEGLTKSYSMNPSYAKANASLVKEGQALVIMSGYEGKKILEELSQMEEWKIISPLLVRVLDLGYNEVVIR